MTNNYCITGVLKHIRNNEVIMDLIKNKIINYDLGFENGKLDFRLNKLMTIPDIQKKIIQLIMEEINKPFNSNFDYVVSSSDYGTILANQISLILNKPQLVKEDIQCSKNSMKGKIIMIETIIDNGKETVNLVGKLRDIGLDVIEIICLFQKEQLNMGKLFAEEILKRRNRVITTPIFSNNSIDFYSRFKEKRLCVSIDLDSIEKLEYVIQKIHKYVSIIKIHIDNIKNFDPYVSIKKLNQIKYKYGIILWENRKFADGATAIHNQLHESLYSISSWADLISVHTLAGSDAFTIVGNCKVVAILEMSNRYSLTDEKYIKNSLNMVENFSSVLGIYCLSDLDTHLLKFVPGINNLNTEENVGGKYTSLSEIQWADIIIEGNHIIKNIENPNLELICNAFE